MLCALSALRVFVNELLQRSPIGNNTPRRTGFRFYFLPKYEKQQIEQDPRVMRQYIRGVLAGALMVCPAMAEDPPPFVDFSAKRVGVPQATSAKRITVQIARVQPGQLEEAATSAPTPSSEAAAWYWSQISDRLEDADAARLQAALSALANANGQVSRPALQDLTRITSAHGTDLLLTTAGSNVSPALALAVAAVESSGRIDAVSSAGARGLMQLMPATAERFGVLTIDDPSENIKGGVAYLDWLMEEFDRDPILVLAAYNAGEGAVRKHGGVPPYAETRNYVPKVLAAWEVAKGLCRTPPELLSDPCIFVSGPNG